MTPVGIPLGRVTLFHRSASSELLRDLWPLSAAAGWLSPDDAARARIRFTTGQLAVCGS